MAIAYALEGAEVAIFYNENDGDAETTKKMVKDIGNKDCLVIKGDVRNYEACENAIALFSSLLTHTSKSLIAFSTSTKRESRSEVITCQTISKSTSK